MRVVLDVDVVLDVLQRRQPFFADSSRLLAAIEEGRLEGLLAAHSVTTLFSLYSKYDSPAAARVHLVDLLGFMGVAPVDHAVLEEALALPYPDFEDCVQMTAARRTRADYLVTRDRACYSAGPVPALSPAELLALLE